MPSFSELMPILLNVLIGIPQMFKFSNIRMVLICPARIHIPCEGLTNVTFLAGQTSSLRLEPPESGLLSRSACNEKKERLANSCLLVQAYGFLGILKLLCALRCEFPCPSTSLVSPLT